MNKIKILITMFTKAFVTWKKGYGEDIALKVCSILRDLDIQYGFYEPRGCDLAIMIGGDGTLLRNQSFLRCPIFGINPGRSIGFYMAAGRKDFEKGLRKILTGSEGRDYFVKKFLRLETSINGTEIPFLALNEVLVSPIYARRILDSELKIKRERTRESNSGILVYTPSGSHAYAKSAGAKPLKDEKRFGVVAIAPYSGRLKRGEITLSEGTVTVRCLNDEGEVCVDGQDHQVTRLVKGDVVKVRKSSSPAHIITFRS